MRGSMHEQSRYVVAIAIAFGIPTMIVVGLTKSAPDPVVTYGYPPLVAYLVVYGWVLVRRPTVAVAFSRFTLILFEVVWTGTMAVRLARSTDARETWFDLFPLFFLGIVVFLIVGFLFFSARQGLVHAAVVAVVIMVAAWAAAQAAPGGGALVPDIVRYTIYLLVIALLLHVLSQAKARLALAVAAAQRAAAEATEMRDMAYLDPLTGVANRRRLVEELSYQSSRVRPEHPVAVVYFDLDRFKAINDTRGHATGDDVLCGVARVASRMLRHDDVVGRLGGEEFVVVAPGTSQVDALALAERLRAALPVEVGSALGVPVTASFGVSMLRPGESASAVLDRVDGLMYDAKAAGRDRVVSGSST